MIRYGARHFTAARVAEHAGVSVGSLYQYFPNKEAILFRLQLDEWKRTGSVLESILADSTIDPFERIQTAVREFFRSEREEAELRRALGKAAPLYLDVPEMRKNRRAGLRRVVVFMRQALPASPARTRALAADVVLTTLSAVGERVTEGDRTPGEVERFAAAISAMFCDYLRGIRSVSLTARIGGRLRQEKLDNKIIKIKKL